jgi:DNA replication protein DnaC
MILSNTCYLKETDKCKKYLNGNCSSDTPEFCIKLFKIDHLFNQALLSDKQKVKIDLRIDSDGTDKDAFLILKDIQNNITGFVKEGANLYLHSSNCGNGKTAWAIRMIQEYIKKIWHTTDLGCKALFINVPRFLLALKDNISEKNEYIEHIKKNVLEADLVVWDEIGVSNLTKFEHENMLNFINTRIDLNKSNIYTSNMSPNELKEKIGDRLYSRVVNLSVDIELHGLDKRGFAR